MLNGARVNRGVTVPIAVIPTTVREGVLFYLHFLTSHVASYFPPYPVLQDGTEI